MRHHEEVRGSAQCAAQSSCSVETLCSYNDPVLFSYQESKREMLLKLQFLLLIFRAHYAQSEASFIN